MPSTFFDNFFSAMIMVMYKSVFALLRESSSATQDCDGPRWYSSPKRCAWKNEKICSGQITYLLILFFIIRHCFIIIIKFCTILLILCRLWCFFVLWGRHGYWWLECCATCSCDSARCRLRYFGRFVWIYSLCLQWCVDILSGYVI